MLLIKTRGLAMPNITIRKATVEDVSLIFHFIKQLAIYEKAEDAVVATVADIKNSLFSDSATAYALIALLDDKPVGFCVYFYNYSTWLGKNGLYLEDLFVLPEHRGTGIGKALLKYLAKIAIKNNCGRFEWSVLDWNEPAINFYQSIGAKPQDEWIIYRLAGDELKEFAES